MSDYVMSDIHGHLDLFKKMLEIIKFDFEKDSLYLLGDYVDWGHQSIETILYVMELDTKYDNVHVLLGNHDLMFLNQAMDYFKTRDYEDYNWMYRNRGKETFDQFLELDESVQKKVVDYLDNLPYRMDIEVENKKYILAHSCPQPLMDYTKCKDNERELQKYKHYRYTAVWERIIYDVPNVIRWFDKEHIYDNFICGHTINDDYKIHNEEDYIDVDCGAKVIGYTMYEEEQYAKLACLRLNDMQEFYVR